jgi:hypothetical protein
VSNAAINELILALNLADASPGEFRAWVEAECAPASRQPPVLRVVK